MSETQSSPCSTPVSPASSSNTAADIIRLLNMAEGLIGVGSYQYAQHYGYAANARAILALTEQLADLCRLLKAKEDSHE